MHKQSKWKASWRNSLIQPSKLAGYWNYFYKKSNLYKQGRNSIHTQSKWKASWRNSSRLDSTFKAFSLFLRNDWCFCIKLRPFHVRKYIFAAFPMLNEWGQLVFAEWFMFLHKNTGLFVSWSTYLRPFPCQMNEDSLFLRNDLRFCIKRRPFHVIKYIFAAFPMPNEWG